MKITLRRASRNEPVPHSVGGTPTCPNAKVASSRTRATAKRRQSAQMGKKTPTTGPDTAGSVHQMVAVHQSAVEFPAHSPRDVGSDAMRESRVFASGWLSGRVIHKEAEEGTP